MPGWDGVLGEAVEVAGRDGRDLMEGLTVAGGADERSLKGDAVDGVPVVGCLEGAVDADGLVAPLADVAGS